MAIENPSAFLGPTNSIVPGMTLRDYFAGQALAGVCANTDFLTNLHKSGDVTELAAASAYEFADAMLAQRQESRDG